MAQKNVKTRKTTYRTEVQGNVARQMYAVPDRHVRPKGPMEVQTEDISRKKAI